MTQQRAKTARVLQLPRPSNPVMAEQDLTRSLSEAVSRAISETVSAFLSQVSIQLALQSFEIVLNAQLSLIMPLCSQSSQNSPANQHVQPTGNSTSSTPTSTIQQSNQQNQQVRSIERNLCKEENTDHFIQQQKITTLLQKVSSCYY